METINLPTWALCAIVNGDYDGLEDGEIEQISTFLQTFEYIDHDSSEFFTWNPQFGLACTCVEATVNPITI